MKVVIHMQNVKEKEKKWSIVAEGFFTVGGMPIIIHQKATAVGIHEVWEEFRMYNDAVTFTAVSINEVKRNERSEGIS